LSNTARDTPVVDKRSAFDKAETNTSFMKLHVHSDHNSVRKMSDDEKLVAMDDNEKPEAETRVKKSTNEAPKHTNDSFPPDFHLNSNIMQALAYQYKRYFKGMLCVK